MNIPSKDFRFPTSMTPKLAVNVSRCITGLPESTVIVKYLALAYVFTTWHFDVAAEPAALEMALREVPNDSPEVLLTALTDEKSYQLKAFEKGLAKEKVMEVKEFLRSVKAYLKRKNINVMKLHIKALRHFKYVTEMSECDLREGTLLMYAIAKELEDHYFETMDEGATVEDLQKNLEALNQILQKAKKETVVSYESLGPGAIQVFDPLLAKRYAAKAIVESTGNSASNRQASMLERMAVESGFRGVAEVASETAITELRDKFPHFSEVIDLIEESLALAASGTEGSPVKFPPIFLTGRAGTGKTYFAQEVARLLGAPYVERDLAVTSDAFVLTGMDPTWKDSRPGLIFETLVDGTCANPVISLNEVDKAAGSGTEYRNPLSALYQLLEPASSVIFKDEHVPVPINASRINWILTGNSSALPEPILSRCEVYEIEMPSPEHGKLIAASVWREICTKYLPAGHKFPATLPAEALELLCRLVPREIRRTLMRAAGSAAKDHRSDVAPADLKRVMKQKSSSKTSIGFLTP